MEARDVKQGRFGIVFAAGWVAALLGLATGPLRAEQNEAKVRGAITVNAKAEFVTIAGQNNATEIEAELEQENEGDDDHGGHHGGHGGDDQNEDAKLAGRLTAVNLAAGTITVAPADGSAPITLKIDAGTDVEIDDADLTLAQLAALLTPGAGVPVQVEYLPATLVATEVEVQAALGVEDDKVVSTDLRSNSMVVANSRGRTSRVQLLPGSVLTTSRGLTRLANVRRGDAARVSSFTSRGLRIAPHVHFEPAPHR
jgi:hypothetical protein